VQKDDGVACALVDVNHLDAGRVEALARMGIGGRNWSVAHLVIPFIALGRFVS